MIGGYQDFKGFFHNFLHEIQDVRADLLGLNQDIVVIFLIAILLDDQILKNGEQNFAGVHQLKLILIIELSGDLAKIFFFEKVFDQNWSIFDHTHSFE